MKTTFELTETSAKKEELWFSVETVYLRTVRSSIKAIFKLKYRSAYMQISD